MLHGQIAPHRAINRGVGAQRAGAPPPYPPGSLAAIELQRLRFVAKKGIAMKYKIALRESEEGFSVSVPGLPGCWSQGTTEEEALQNIQDAIKEYLATAPDPFEGATVREIEVSA